LRLFDLRLLRAARSARAALAVAIGLGVLSAALAIAQAALLADAISRAFLGGAAIAALAGTLALLAAVLLGRATAAWAGESLSRRCSAGVKSALRRQVLSAALEPLPRSIPDRSRADVVSVVTRGLDALDEYFSGTLPQLVLSVLVPVAVVGAAASVDLVAAATIGLTIPVMVLFMVLIGSFTAERRRRRWTALTRLSHAFLDVVAGLPTLRVFGRSATQRRALDVVTDAYRRESLSTLRIAFLSSFALELGATLSVALVAVGVGLRLVAGELDLRTGLFVLVLAPEAYLPLRQFAAHYHASQGGLAAADAAFGIIEAAAGTSETSPTAVPRAATPRPPMEVRVRDLGVEHPGRDLEAPSGAGLTLRSGEVVAVVGPSGAGKTTLLECLARLVAPTRGEILITGADGLARPLDALDRADWWRSLGWVPQRPFLFAGSVTENVRLGDARSSEEAVQSALSRVGLGRLDPGMQLGEGGTGLSSGERRRLAVARAILRNPAVLLLDEPTAGLDAHSEGLVLRAVRDAAARGAAVLLVAHRPAAIAAADRSVLLRSRAVAREAA
jgi:ATP-binding cassette, subfamily C, bacterial CydCD